ncbi:mechanosensitive ion channel family protein [Oscillatoria salina]|uniref:mechanosensitive ion channel family protein n=1 Tax=Oscillatoria salina TaxID=331517 RepID=UPI0013B6E6F5|nr:mechanosensitive ion channel family protein [Oscillatoria salina]MBZ8179277.1 mechanosensitive ion channel family protein [Oscillatoria salina IIICB1]NET86754.1 mechanosensitive ion channel family protein [Kamptonema sp. SIO1D9]
MQIDSEILEYIWELMARLGLFSLAVVISPFAGQFVLQFIQLILKLLDYRQIINAKAVYARSIEPFENSLWLIGVFFFIAIALNLLIKYEELHKFLGFFVYSTLSIGIGWFTARIVRKIIHRSVISLVHRWFGKVNEVVLIFETLSYVLIVVMAIVIFAIGLQVELFPLLAGLGISGAVLGLAAQQTLGQLFGTLELYLDRPYLCGEYIRVNFNPYAEDVYGRIESIGLRSTKIRIVAQNTIMIVPNLTMAGKNIENVSRGKKTMAMLCLDFSRYLREEEQALVTQIIEQESRLFWGFDRASTRVQYEKAEPTSITRARVFFFLTSPSENSLELRKRLLELANEAIAKKLAVQNLRFIVPEPTIYIDSPMSL